MKYVDFHCDTLLKACLNKKASVGEFPEASVDIARLRKAGAGAQFFAAFLPTRESDHWREKLGMGDFLDREGFEAEDRYISMARVILKKTVEEYPEDLMFAQTGSHLKTALSQGKTAAFFTIEDGRSVGGSLEKLKYYQELGVSLISLTWNFENCFGYPNSTEKERMARGLKPFGKEAVEYMNDLGMVVDVSHLSDGGFWDVADISRKPFIASHSNCRALASHPRNLTDDMIRALAEKGGVAGLNFYYRFLTDDTQNQKSCVEHMVAHVKHLVNTGGLECAAIGTDFDGIEGCLEIGEPTQMEYLVEGLRKVGFTQDEVDRILWKNALRVLCDIAG